VPAPSQLTSLEPDRTRRGAPPHPAVPGGLVPHATSPLHSRPQAMGRPHRQLASDGRTAHRPTGTRGCPPPRRGGGSPAPRKPRVPVEVPPNPVSPGAGPSTNYPAIVVNVRCCLLNPILTFEKASLVRVGSTIPDPPRANRKSRFQYPPPNPAWAHRGGRCGAPPPGEVICPVELKQLSLFAEVGTPAMPGWQSAIPPRSPRIKTAGENWRPLA